MLGVKHRVYDVEDALLFGISNKETRQKEFERFKNSSMQLSNEEYFRLLLLENTVFRQFFWVEEHKHLCFCINQVTNIILNYKLFLWLKLDGRKFIDMIAFQIALIIEYMYKNGFDIRAFNESLQEKNFCPFVESILANDLAYKYIELLKILKKNFANNNYDKKYNDVISKMDQEIKKLDNYDKEFFSNSNDNYKRKISQWKNKKILPSFVDIVVVSLAKYKERHEPFFIYAIQMLIARVLLDIQYHHKSVLKNDTENYFLEQLSKFRQELNKIFDKNDYLSSVEQQQCQYLIPIGGYIFNDINFGNDDTVKSKYEDIVNSPKIGKMVELLSQSEFGKTVSQKIQESQKKMQDITKDVTPVFNDKNYKQVIEILDEQNELFYHPRSFLIQFIAAVKLNDDKLAKQYFKLLDRDIGSIFTLYKIQAKNFKKSIENIDDLKGCIEKIFESLKNVGN